MKQRSEPVCERPTEPTHSRRPEPGRGTHATGSATCHQISEHIHVTSRRAPKGSLTAITGTTRAGPTTTLVSDWLRPTQNTRVGQRQVLVSGWARAHAVRCKHMLRFRANLSAAGLSPASTLLAQVTGGTSRFERNVSFKWQQLETGPQLMNERDRRISVTPPNPMAKGGALSHNSSQGLRRGGCHPGHTTTSNPL